MSERCNNFTAAHGHMQSGALFVERGHVLDARDRWALALIRAWAEHIQDGKSLDPGDIYTTAVKYAPYPKESRDAA